MKTSDIGRIIENFLKSEATAIIVDGNWGIGKTYAIKEFLREQKDKSETFDYCKIHYTSLFGFKNIETLHKELYKKFHPFKARTAKALSYISLAISLNKATSIGLNTNEIRKDIEDNQSNETLSKKYYSNVIIFDDIERVASNSDGLIELFGYLNRLTLEGIKIIAICNSNELSIKNKKIFDKFKEKLFDRIYTIDENNMDIIKKIFGNKFNLLDDDSISFFEKNLRMVKKTKIFIDDTLYQLSKSKDYQKIDDRIVCLICILIVKEVFTSSLSSEFFTHQKEKQESKNQNEKILAKMILDKQHTDEFSIKAIEHELAKIQIFGKTLLIRGLFNYFKYYDCSYFKELPSQQKLLQKSLFYYNDNDKEKVIAQILDIINTSFDNISFGELTNTIRDILQYNDGILKDEQLYRLAELIISSNKSERLIDQFIYEIYSEHSNEEKKFAKILKTKYKEQQQCVLLDYFKSLNIDKYNGELLSWISKLQGKPDPLHTNTRDYLKDTKFLIPDLSKTLSENAWHYSHDICNFIMKVDFSLKTDLLVVLDEQLKNNPKEKCVKERVESLKKHKLQET